MALDGDTTEQARLELVADRARAATDAYQDMLDGSDQDGVADVDDWEAFHDAMRKLEAALPAVPSDHA